VKKNYSNIDIQTMQNSKWCLQYTNRHRLTLRT